MEYALCIRSNVAESVFRIKAKSMVEAREKFIHMKQMTAEQFDKIFIVVEIPHGK